MGVVRVLVSLWKFVLFLLFIGNLMVVVIFFIFIWEYLFFINKMKELSEIDIVICSIDGMLLKY